MTVEQGKTVANPGVPSRNGYEFTGWTLNGSAYNFSTPVNGNITLVAGWKAVESYTFSVTTIDDYSPSRKVLVYKNGVDVTASVAAVYTSSGAYLGGYESRYGAIIVDKADAVNIGAIKVNGTLVSIKKR